MIITTNDMPARMCNPKRMNGGTLLLLLPLGKQKRKAYQHAELRNQTRTPIAEGAESRI